MLCKRSIFKQKLHFEFNRQRLIHVEGKLHNSVSIVGQFEDTLGTILSNTSQMKPYF